MDPEELKKLQTPLKDKYRKEPEAAKLTLRADVLVGFIKADLRLFNRSHISFVLKNMLFH
jgi:hypothetical protein